jgi:hypothetical protein
MPEVCGAFVPCPAGAPAAPDLGASTATPDWPVAPCAEPSPGLGAAGGGAFGGALAAAVPDEGAACAEGAAPPAGGAAAGSGGFGVRKATSSVQILAGPFCGAAAAAAGAAAAGGAAEAAGAGAACAGAAGAGVGAAGVAEGAAGAASGAAGGGVCAMAAPVHTVADRRTRARLCISFTPPVGGGRGVAGLLASWPALPRPTGCDGLLPNRGPPRRSPSRHTRPPCRASRYRYVRG